MTEQLPDERPTRRREYSGATSTLGVAALIVVVVGLSLWFFQFRGSGGGSGTPHGAGVIALPVSLNTTGKAPAAEVGRAAPDFELASLDGGKLRLDSLHGQWVLLNFWASWCAPCRSETPQLQALHQTLQQAGKQVTIVGVDQQETQSAAEKFAKQFGVTYPMVLDSSGEVSVAYHVDRGLPDSFLISPSGVVEHVYLGEMTADDFATLQKEMMG